MCEMCEAAVDSFKKRPIRGWGLIRATRNGEYLFKGDLGIVQVNNPAIFWQPDEFERKRFDVGEFESIWKRRWKKIRRAILKHGICGKKVDRLTKDPELLKQFIAKEVTDWHDTQPFFVEEHISPISAVNMDAQTK